MARGFSVSVVAGALALAFGAPALAQNGAAPNDAHTMAAPDYSSDIHVGTMSSGNFNTPEADGRPGVYFFQLGSRAFRDKDYRHAVSMFKVAASWAYKPAEYDLGLMYFRGEGVPADRARGAAWMVLAAERNAPMYVRARDLMITQLSNAEFKHTDELWADLKRTYGDKVALRRAKAQWQSVRMHQTGTRVGGAVGELAVGALDTGHTPNSLTVATTSDSSLVQGGSVDGAVAYGEFEQSDNPYDPIFQKDLTGTATVGPLMPAKASDTSTQQQPDNGGHNP